MRLDTLSHEIRVVGFCRQGAIPQHVRRFRGVLLTSALLLLRSMRAASWRWRMLRCSATVNALAAFAHQAWRAPVRQLPNSPAGT